MKKANVPFEMAGYIIAALIVAFVVFQVYLLLSDPIVRDGGGGTTVNCIAAVDPRYPSPCPTPTPPWWQFWGH